MPADHLLPGSVSPIPAAALDDRLGFTGNSGSGKTYGAGVGVEQILADRRRVVIPDPLGVWWGLRLRADGTPSRFDVVIFGGPHGDIAINEHAGAVIGETVASMKESAIVDLSQLGTKAAERRFMFAFLTALYRKTSGAPLHVVFDEADMWAPQQPRDNDGGDAPRLLGMMETIVRRGRVKGFIPWLITQRPAVLNKDVLSQVDGLIAFKLTSSQDRKALGAWIEGQADRDDGKRLLGDMPTLERGRAVVWLPARGILKPASFPKKVTFDSSAAPKRGEAVKTVALQPLDLGALRDKLASVETEAKANDPVALKKRISELEKMVKAPAKVMPDPNVIAAAEERGFERGLAAAGSILRERMRTDLDLITAGVKGLEEELAHHAQHRPAPPLKRAPPESLTTALSHNKATAMAETLRENPQLTLTGPQIKIVNALRFWESLGYDQPTRDQVAAVAGYSVNSGAFKNPMGALNSTGIISYPQPGLVKLEADVGEAPADPSGAFRAVVGGPCWKILTAIKDGTVYTRESVAELTGYSVSSGAFKNPMGRLRTLGAITYPEQGTVQIVQWAAEIVT